MQLKFQWVYLPTAVKEMASAAVRQHHMDKPHAEWQMDLHLCIAFFKSTDSELETLSHSPIRTYTHTSAETAIYKCKLPPADQSALILNIGGGASLVCRLYGYCETLHTLQL